MLTGTVNSLLEPRLSLSIRGAARRRVTIEAIVDSGFNGFLTLPAATAAVLRLPWLCRQEGQLADSTVHLFEVHAATVILRSRLLKLSR